MRSTGGLVPVRVWVSYESLARGKSVRNHLKPRSHQAPEQFAGPIRVKKTGEPVGNPMTCRKGAK